MLSIEHARACLTTAVYEQRQSDSLLCEMLPRYVAERLKAKLPVEPETFDEASVYFSDIPGFHDAAHNCETPIEVVDLLNAVFG
jgi:hypothetical protein